MDKVKSIIVDLDGTIANINHRLHVIKCPNPDWDKFYAQCANDEINQWCINLMDAMGDAGYQILIVSGRRKSTLKDTKLWLEHYNVPYHKLFLVREDDNFEPDHDLKRKWLHRKFRHKAASKVEFVIDDRTRVVEMWRNEGLTCLQCARWKEYKKPKKKKLIPKDVPWGNIK